MLIVKSGPGALRGKTAPAMGTRRTPKPSEILIGEVLARPGRRAPVRSPLGTGPGVTASPGRWLAGG